MIYGEPKRATAPGRQRPGSYRALTRIDENTIPQLRRLSRDVREAMAAVAAVLPFRVNDYVIEELIDWSKVPDDPIFQLTFPQPGMLQRKDFEHLRSLIRQGASRRELREAARPIQERLNPHPAGQVELNVPTFNDRPVPGLQHKYRDTVLLFPAAGQTCHAYCSYCFRWPQFVGITDLKFANTQPELWQRYLRAHPEVTSALLTGGDPMIMKTATFRRYLEPLLDPSLEQLRSIRIGSKTPAYWPQRFVTDDDADDLLRTFEKIVESGRHLAFMAHYSHPRELDTPMAERAVRRIQETGAVIRSQAPLIRRVNDSADDWAQLWKRQVQLGVVPYYMFVERDTGARDYFEVSLARALQVFRGAYRQVSGLARTVRGPSMSTTPGKILIDSVISLGAERVFELKFLRGRDPTWVGVPFFARFDPEATWLDDLEPAFGEGEFFFEKRLREIAERKIDRGRVDPRTLKQH